MTSSKRLRWAGRTATLAGLLFIVASFLVQVTPQKDFGSPNSPSDYLATFMFTVGFLGVLVGIWGLYSLHRGRHRYLRTVGLWSAFGGAALIILGLLGVLLFAGPDVGPYQGEPDDFAAVLGALALVVLGYGIMIVGFGLLGTACLRAGLLPRWCGVLVIGALPGSFVFSVGLGDKFGVLGGGIALGLAWVLIGFALSSNTSAAAIRSSRTS